MRFPRDGGLTFIRSHIRADKGELAKVALSHLTVKGRVAGRLDCFCGASNDWRLSEFRGCLLLSCGSDGSSLPLYIGPPPRRGRTTTSRFMRVMNSVAAPKVIENALPGHPCSAGNEVAIAIGYNGAVPPRGMMGTEAAQELVVACRCADCGVVYTGWVYRLAEPFPVRAPEPWAIKSFTTPHGDDVLG